jgi:hypothetical protein
MQRWCGCGGSTRMQKRVAPCGVVAIALLGGALPSALGAQAAVVGSVFDSLVARREMRAATVTIIELNREATTDALGRFRFDSVPAGKYQITFFHPALDSLELAAPVALLDVPVAGMINVRLATPSPATAYARLCPGRRDANTGVAFGRVRDVDTGRPIAGAVVNAEWNEWTFGGGRPASRRIARAVARTAPSGGYLLCGIPSDAPIDVRVAAGTQGAGPVPVQPGQQLLARRDFAISRTDPAARVLVRDSGRVVRADSSAPAAGTSAIGGTVRSADGRPQAGALVGVLGTVTSTRASEAGRFRLAAVPAGTRALEIRSVGYTPVTLVVDVASGGSLDTVVTLDKRPQVLAPVSVTAEGEPADRTGFAARRKKGFGSFLTAKDIQKWQPFDMVSAVALAPSVERDWTAQGETILLRGSGGGRCTPHIFIDGGQFEMSGNGSMSELNSLVRPDAIKGMEIYPGPMIPFEFDRLGDNGCGSVVIWTR